MSRFKKGDVIVYFPNPIYTNVVLTAHRDGSYTLKRLTVCPVLGGKVGEVYRTTAKANDVNRLASPLEQLL